MGKLKCEKQTYVKPSGVPGPMYTRCNIRIHAYAGTHNATAPVISCADIDAPSLCHPDKLTPIRGKYQHPSVFRAETKALLLSHCSQILRHPTPPQILDTISR